MARFLERLGRGAARRHWIVLGVWILALVGIFLGAKSADGAYSDNFNIPGADSQHAIDLLESDFPDQTGVTAQIVVEADDGTLSDAANKKSIDEALKNVSELDGVESEPSLTSAPDGEFKDKIGFAQVQYSKEIQDLPKDAFKELELATAPITANEDLTVSLGGELVDFDNPPAAGNADEIGLAFAVIILLFALGSVIAMGLPIGTALLGLGAGIGTLSLLSAFVNIGTVAPTLGTMIGLGVGIDYSLFILMRHRRNLEDGMAMHDSIGMAVATAGQAVLFAGTTVIIALCGLFLAGIPYVGILGFSAAVVVAVMMIAALTLLPALMGLAGSGVMRWHIPGIGPRPKIAPSTDTEEDDIHRPSRYAGFVVRRPWFLLVPILLVLLVLALPTRNMRLGATDDGSAPESSIQRHAYDTLAKGFGPGFNGPLLIAVELPGSDGKKDAEAIQKAVLANKGVEDFPAPVQYSNAKDPDSSKAAVVLAFPTTSPDSVATEDLIKKLRATTIPEAVEGTGAQAFVGGETAEFIDLGGRIQSRLPLFIGAVMGLSLLLMLVVFRTVLGAVAASLLNLVSVVAAYGIITAVFQENVGSSIIGVDQSVPIVSFVPLMLFAILFGLSMDYQVFFLSGVREEFTRSNDAKAAVVFGLGGSSRVIVSAALIMFTVFGSFVLNEVVTVKMFGLGLAVAVLFDALIVLAVMPALMTVFGRAGWWIPRWLDRILPRMEIDAGSATSRRSRAESAPA